MTNKLEQHALSINDLSNKIVGLNGASKSFLCAVQKDINKPYKYYTFKNNSNNSHTSTYYQHR